MSPPPRPPPPRPPPCCRSPSSPASPAGFQSCLRRPLSHLHAAVGVKRQVTFQVTAQFQDFLPHSETKARTPAVTSTALFSARRHRCPRVPRLPRGPSLRPASPFYLVSVPLPCQWLTPAPMSPKRPIPAPCFSFPHGPFADTPAITPACCFRPVAGVTRPRGQGPSCATWSRPGRSE